MRPRPLTPPMCPLPPMRRRANGAASSSSSGGGEALPDSLQERLRGKGLPGPLQDQPRRSKSAGRRSGVQPKRSIKSCKSDGANKTLMLC